MLVSAEGRVEKIALWESCGHALLDRAAIRAVKLWRFDPARRAGVAIAKEILIPIRFSPEKRR